MSVVGATCRKGSKEQQKREENGLKQDTNDCNKVTSKFVACRRKIRVAKRGKNIKQ